MIYLLGDVHGNFDQILPAITEGSGDVRTPGKITPKKLQKNSVKNIFFGKAFGKAFGEGGAKRQAAPPVLFEIKKLESG